MFQSYWNKGLLAIIVIMLYIAAVTFGFTLMSEPSWIKILLGMVVIVVTLWLAPQIFSRIFGEKHEHKQDE